MARTALTLAEREANRQMLREYAQEHALDQHLTLRCRFARETGEDDHACADAACLCTCHDGASPR